VYIKAKKNKTVISHISQLSRRMAAWQLWWRSIKPIPTYFNVKIDNNTPLKIKKSGTNAKRDGTPGQ
jgi:hypothetical protein